MIRFDIHAHRRTSMFAHNWASKVAAGRILAVAGAALAVQGCQSPLDSRAQHNPTAEARSNSVSSTTPGTACEPRVPHDAVSLDDDAALADYLAYAAANSAALRSAFYRWRATVERIPQATSLPDPMLGYGYFLESFTARRPMEQHIFELSQTFPWFGKLRLAGDAASLAAEAAAHEYESMRLSLFLDVRRAYYELYQLGRDVEVTRDNLELLSQFEAIVRARFRAAQATHADVVRVQVELGRMEDRLRQLNDLRRPAAARFNAVLNRSPEAPIVWPRHIPDERLDTGSHELLARLREGNPGLHAMESEVERERTETRLARRNYYPDVTVGGMYALRGNDPLLARISINVPIWPGRYAAGVREASARRIAAAYARHEEVNRLGAELYEVLFDHDDAQRRIELYSATLLPKARESLQASLTAFQGGTTTFLELLDAERTLLEFQLAESRARTDRAIALARLDALVGSPVPRLAAGDTGNADENVHPDNGSDLHGPDLQPPTTEPVP
jgi:outer membrane protein, heavy metal efflux system